MPFRRVAIKANVELLVLNCETGFTFFVFEAKLFIHTLSIPIAAFNVGMLCHDDIFHDSLQNLFLLNLILLGKYK